MESFFYRRISMGKREDYIAWDEYFMGVALLAAKRSKDPSTQVGACIVNQDKKIISTGYNGFPIGISDDDFPWEREGDFLNTKYAYVCHAELNAILNNPGTSLKGCVVYTPLFPCNECAKAIVQSGIAEIIYLSDKYAHTDVIIASKRILDASGVSYRALEAERASITLDFSPEKV